MEQALVLVSIILGVAIAFELENLNEVLRSRKVKWHWAQPAFAILVLLSVIAFWWQAAAAPEGEISLGEFLPVLAQLIMLALMCAVALPGKIGDEGIDLAEYYQENRRYQWGVFAIYFWIVHVGYVISSWQSSATWLNFLAAIGPDSVIGSLVIAMMFIRRWWQVALGFAVFSAAPVLWAFRTLS